MITLIVVSNFVFSCYAGMFAWSSNGQRKTCACFASLSLDFRRDFSLFNGSSFTCPLSCTENEMLVYPVILQERTSTGNMTLRLHDRLTLNLKRSTVLAHKLVMVRSTPHERHVKTVSIFGISLFVRAYNYAYKQHITLIQYNYVQLHIQYNYYSTIILQYNYTVQLNIQYNYAYKQYIGKFLHRLEKLYIQKTFCTSAWRISVNTCVSRYLQRGRHNLTSHLQPVMQPLAHILAMTIKLGSTHCIICLDWNTDFSLYVPK